MTHILLNIAAHAILFMMGLGILCIALSDRGPLVEDDQQTPEKPIFPVPEFSQEATRAKPLRERIAMARNTREARRRWGVQQEIDAMTWPFREGDPR